MIQHVKSHVVRGLIALIPFALCAMAIRLIYLSIDQRMVGVVGDWFGVQFPGLGILFLLASLYVIGLVTSNIVGRKALSVVDRITSHLPIVKTAYQVGKQITSAFSQSGKQAFKRAVLIEVRTGSWMIGLVTGETRDADSGALMLHVYLPLPPNPTSGALMLVPETDVRDPGWTVEEALKLTMSAGIIGPGRLGASR